MNTSYKKYPAKHARDTGRGMTMGELAVLLANAADKDEEKFVDAIDEEFIWGAWGYILREPHKDEIPPESKAITHSPQENLPLNSDIRGLVLEMYQEGRRRGAREARQSQNP